jgi:hypothetical protein
MSGTVCAGVHAWYAVCASECVQLSVLSSCAVRASRGCPGQASRVVPGQARPGQARPGCIRDPARLSGRLCWVQLHRLRQPSQPSSVQVASRARLVRGVLRQASCPAGLCQAGLVVQLRGCPAGSGYPVRLGLFRLSASGTVVQLLS